MSLPGSPRRKPEEILWFSGGPPREAQRKPKDIPWFSRGSRSRSSRRKLEEILWFSGRPPRGALANTFGYSMVFLWTMQGGPQRHLKELFFWGAPHGAFSENIRKSNGFLGVTSRKQRTLTGSPMVSLRSPERPQRKPKDIIRFSLRSPPQGALSENSRKSNGFREVTPREPWAKT